MGKAACKNRVSLDCETEIAYWAIEEARRAAFVDGSTFQLRLHFMATPVTHSTANADIGGSSSVSSDDSNAPPSVTLPKTLRSNLAALARVGATDPIELVDSGSRYGVSLKGQTITIFLKSQPQTRVSLKTNAGQPDSLQLSNLNQAEASRLLKIANEALGRKLRGLPAPSSSGQAKAPSLAQASVPPSAAPTEKQATPNETTPAPLQNSPTVPSQTSTPTPPTQPDGQNKGKTTSTASPPTGTQPSGTPTSPPTGSTQPSNGTSTGKSAAEAKPEKQEEELQKKVAELREKQANALVEVATKNAELMKKWVASIVELADMRGLV